MASRFCCCIVVAALLGPSWAADPRADPAAIAQSNRLLEEELKLAARPHLYLVLDLTSAAVLIKGRGLELQRIPIEEWTIIEGAPVAGVYRLRSRPAVTRPKAAAADDAAFSAIELTDMPDSYELYFEPGLLIAVSAPWRERPWPWIKHRLGGWWTRLRAAAGFAPGDAPPIGVRIHLSLRQEAAQSLAWSVVDGMPLITDSPPSTP
ncbi:hypothetical protein [Candidatus Nitrospira bockiana]